MLRVWFYQAVLSLGLATGAAAQDAELKALDTGVEASAWEAVGRLDLAGEGFCTGALIAADLVLTAAHCLYDKASGALIDTSRVEFLAGWRNGRASAYRNVRKVAVHPNYDHGVTMDASVVQFDLALIELAHPIRNGRIEPFLTARRPNAGTRVGVVSYAKDRSESPSLQEVCEVLGHGDGVLVTSCIVDFGASGAPIFTFEDGRPQIVSVVSAKAMMEGADVSLGTALDLPLEALRTELSRDAQTGRALLPDENNDLVGTPRRETGAKFIRP